MATRLALHTLTGSILYEEVTEDTTAADICARYKKYPHALVHIVVGGRRIADTERVLPLATSGQRVNLLIRLRGD